jgi:hypothetical protein
LCGGEVEVVMVITVPPEIGDALVEAARKLGVTPEDLVLDTLRAKLAASTQPAPRDPWEDLLLSAGSPAGISLGDEVTSRESLYD